MRRLLSIYLLAGAAMAQIQIIQQAPTPDTAAAPAGTGSIQGVVLDAATHAPLAKAQVTVTGGINAPLTAVTGADGRFVFHDLGQGSYWLNASKNGYNVSQAVLGPDANTGVTLGSGEEKKGVEISLLPGGEIAGRVVDEEGAPVRGCTVSAVQLIYEQNQRNLIAVAGGTPTNDKGDYRDSGLAPGRYYVFAHCQVELPAPHPLLPRGDPRTPHETYLSQFYGGGLDPAMATRLTVLPGSPLQGVDFRMTRVPAFALRGSVAPSDTASFPGGVNVMLLPANPMMRSLMLTSAGVEPQTGKFQFQPVMPGAYVLLAFHIQEGRACIAQHPLEVGSVAPDPLAISIECGAELKGSLQFDSDEHPPLENNHVTLTPLDGPLFIPQPQAATDKDGAFTFGGVPSGRWRLVVNAPGFVKSASLAGQPIAPDGFQLASGAGPLRIVVGSKMTEVRVEVTGAPPDRQISALIFPEDTTRLGVGLERTGAALGTGHIEFGGMAPGRYRIIAMDSPNPSMILQRPDWLKALESRSTAVDVPEGGHVSATVEIIPREELLRALNE